MIFHKRNIHLPPFLFGNFFVRNFREFLSQFLVDYFEIISTEMKKISIAEDLFDQRNRRLGHFGGFDTAGYFFNKEAPACCSCKKVVTS